MTKEDIKQICQIYDNFRSERDAATIAYNSDDTFWGHILATYNLSQPSLPSNLDEVAEESARAWRKNPDSSESREIFFQPYIRGFKSGAEWMAGQGETVEGEIVCAVAHPHENKVIARVYCDYKFGDKVVVQIRKK